jgi:hypothetical protein
LLRATIEQVTTRLLMEWVNGGGDAVNAVRPASIGPISFMLKRGSRF